MKPNTSLSGAASRNGTSADSLAGRHRQAFTLVDRRPWSRKFGGFTLTELLVVIAIMSLLMGILVPVIGLINDIVAHRQCDNSLRNMWFALEMYAGDNGGQFPDVSADSQVSQKVKEALQPYANSEEIFWCRRDREKSKDPEGGYEWRVTLDPETSLAGVRLDLLRHPNKVIIAGELCHSCHKPQLVNVLYADGHVDLVTKEEFLRNITTPLEFV